MSPRPRLAIAATCCLMAARVAFSAGSTGFGEPWIADTSVSAALQTFSVEVPSTLTANGTFGYEIGFGTAEQSAIGALFDSMTIALSQPDGSQSINIATADVFGLTVIPISPTGLLANGGISIEQISPNTTTLRDSPTMFAYTIGISLPPALAGQNLRTTFSFFNNGDAVPSVGHASVVPEPRAFALAIAGFLVIASTVVRRAQKR